MRGMLAGLIAATLAASATAQSSLRLYGGIDLAITRYKGEGRGAVTQLVSGGNQNNRIGVRGIEDLGGGTWAGFELEAGLSPDTGAGLPSNANNQPSGTVLANPSSTQALTFNRRAILQLGGSWGELRLGRDYVPSFWPLYLYDPFRTGVGFGGITILGTTVTNLRASNSIAYVTPHCDGIFCKGLFGHVMAALGESPSGSATPHDGNVRGLRVGYGGEGWEASIAQSTTTAAAVRDFTQTSGGGTIDFSWGKLMLLAGANRTGAPVAVLANGTRAPFAQVGAMVRAGPGYIPVALTRVRRNGPDPSGANKLAIGYVYEFSRRTVLYTTYARIDNGQSLSLPVNVGADSGPVPIPGGRSTGFDIGVRHVF